MTARTALYRYFATDESLLYVGIAFDPEARARQHARSAADTWWALAATRTDEWFDSRQEAERAEVAAIVSERPRFNVKDNPHQSADVQHVRAVRALKAERLPQSDAGQRYKRVAELIRSKIQDGELARGATVPRQAYAVEFGVSSETVKRACDELEMTGLLQRGHGHHVPAGPAVEYKVFRLPVNRPEEAAEALRSVMTQDELDALIAALRAPRSEAA